MFKKQQDNLIQEMVGLDNQQKMSYKQMLKRLGRIENTYGGSVTDRSSLNVSIKDPILLRGSAPDLNCIACDQEIKPDQFEHLFHNERKVNHSRTVNTSADSFPIRSIGKKMANLNMIIENSKKQRQEEANKIFEHNKNLENEIKQWNHENSEPKIVEIQALTKPGQKFKNVLAGGRNSLVVNGGTDETNEFFSFNHTTLENVNMKSKMPQADVRSKSDTKHTLVSSRSEQNLHPTLPQISSQVNLMDTRFLPHQIPKKVKK